MTVAEPEAEGDKVETWNKPFKSGLIAGAVIIPHHWRREFQSSSWDFGEPTDECQPLNLSSGGEYTLLTYLEVAPSEAESGDKMVGPFGCGGRRVSTVIS